MTLPSPYKIEKPGCQQQTRQQVELDGTGGFSCVLTNKRVILFQPGLFHDVALSAVAAVSWGKSRLSVWLLIFGMVLAAAGLIALTQTQLQSLPIIAIIAGLGLIALWAYWKRESLRLFTTGSRTLTLAGSEEVLRQLLLDLRQTLCP